MLSEVARHCRLEIVVNRTMRAVEREYEMYRMPVTVAVAVAVAAVYYVCSLSMGDAYNSASILDTDACLRQRIVIYAQSRKGACNDWVPWRPTRVTKNMEKRIRLLCNHDVCMISIWLKLFCFLLLQLFAGSNRLSFDQQQRWRCGFENPKLVVFVFFYYFHSIVVAVFSITHAPSNKEYIYNND